MKRILSYISILAILLLGAGHAMAADTLWGYYGGQLPSIEERAVTAAGVGIFNYSGTHEQNVLLLERLKAGVPLFEKDVGEDEIGVSVVTGYEKTLRTSMNSTQTTVPASSMLLRDGSTLTISDLDNQVFLVIEPGKSREEIVMCTGISSNDFTGCTRGLAFSGTSTVAVAANQKTHNAGSTIVISNSHYVFTYLLDNTKADTVIGTGSDEDHTLTFNTGTSTDPGLKYEQSTNQFQFRRRGESTYREVPLSLRGNYANFASLPTTDNSAGDIAITNDDNKLYTYATSTATWVLAGGSSGAGTVYRTLLLGSEADGGDNQTFTLSSGSWPESKFLQVFLNGVYMREGASYDYTITDTNTIAFNYTVANGDTIGMYVVSVDLYNPDWEEVNTDLLPDVDATHDVGSSTLQFDDAYFSGTIYGTIGDATSTPTADKIVIASSTGKIADGWLNQTQKNTISLTAGETINGATLPVAVFVSSTDGEVYAADADDTEALNVIGLATSNGTDGSGITIQTQGLVDGFTGLTIGSSYYVQDDKTLGTSPGTTGVLVGRATSATEMLILELPKYASGIMSPVSENSDITVDDTIVLGFQPRKITLNYWIQGKDSTSATGLYEQQRGKMYYEGTVLTSVHRDWFGTHATDQTSPSVLTEGIANPNTTAPTEGTNSGNTAIKITLTVNSISATGFVIRAAIDAGSGSPGNARAHVSYEVFE